MAGFSLILVNLWLFISFIMLIAGVVVIIVGTILLVRKYKVNSNRKTGKIVAIILLILGGALLIPFLITLSGAGIGKYMSEQDKIETWETLENKIIVSEDEWKNGFMYQDKKLVPIGIFTNSENYQTSGTYKNLNYLGVIAINDTYDYYNFYDIHNNSGYNIYYVWVESFAGGECYTRTFVEESEYDSVLKYYELLPMRVRVLWESAPEDLHLGTRWQRMEINSQDIQSELMELSHEVLDDVTDRRKTSTTTDNTDEAMSIKFLSDDGVFSLKLDIFMREDEMILFVNEYPVETEITEKYQSVLLTFMDEIKEELNNN